MIIEGINFEPLLKARSKFESFRHNVSSQEKHVHYKKRIGAIQAFEYCRSYTNYLNLTYCFRKLIINNLKF